MGDVVALLNGWNLSPLNTVLLAGLAFFIKWAVKQIFERLHAVEEKDRAQDLALARIEERLGIGPRPYLPRRDAIYFTEQEPERD